MDRQATPVADPLHWLIALCEHLVSAFEIVNSQGEPILAALPGDTPSRLRRCLAPPQSVEIRAVLDAASRHASVVFADIAGLRIGAIALVAAVDEELTLLLAERLGTGQRSNRPDELTRTGRWLAKAIRRSSARSGDPSRDWHELYLLHRILASAAAKGSDVGVVQALVDALAIWVDTDTRAYALTRSGEFVLEVGLPGADPAPAPRVIDARKLPAFADPTRLAPAEAERLGFRPTLDVILQTIEDGGSTPWLLAHLGRFSAHDEERLALFSDLLLPAVHAARAVEVARLVWAMTQELVSDQVSAIEAAEAALAELGRATLATASLTVRPENEPGRLMEIGPGQPAVGPSLTAATPALRLPLALSSPFQAMLVVARSDDRPFAVREQRLAEAGATVLASWLSTALARGEIGEPRSSALPMVDRSLDRRGRRPEARPDDVSLLVIRPTIHESTGDVRELWVGSIRRRIRPSDVAGALPSGEIGVLLPETGAADAHAVMNRLRRLFENDESLYLLEPAPIGVATSRGATSDVATLLHHARGGVQGRAHGPAQETGGVTVSEP